MGITSSSEVAQEQQERMMQIVQLDRRRGLRTSPTQVPTQGQWWSNLRTQLSHTAQWEHRGGRKWLHVEHHFVLTV